MRFSSTARKILLDIAMTFNDRTLHMITAISVLGKVKFYLCTPPFRVPTKVTESFFTIFKMLNSQFEVKPIFPPTFAVVQVRDRLILYDEYGAKHSVVQVAVLKEGEPTEDDEELRAVIGVPPYKPFTGGIKRMEPIYTLNLKDFERKKGYYCIGNMVLPFHAFLKRIYYNPFFVNEPKLRRWIGDFADTSNANKEWVRTGRLFDNLTLPNPYVHEEFSELWDKYPNCPYGTLAKAYLITELGQKVRFNAYDRVMLRYAGEVFWHLL